MSDSNNTEYNNIVVFTGENTINGDMNIGGELILLEGKLEKIEEYLEKKLGKNYEVLKDKTFEGNVNCSQDVYYLEFSDIQEKSNLNIQGNITSVSNKVINLDK